MGINTNAPTEALDVSGNARIRVIPYSAAPNNFLARDTDGSLRWSDIATLSAGSSYWSGNGTHVYNTNAGNVGIGTTTP